jgi:DNA-binding transcriptional ArsR family regulator
MMLDVEVIADAETAALALDPIRNRLLSELRAPASATSVAGHVGLTRQKANYYLRDLEKHGLIATAGERRWGGLTERLFVATARSYVVSPDAMGGISVDPSASRDRLSASYAVAVASRIVSEVGGLWRAARTAGKRLATLSIDTEITFRSPAERAAFTRELGEAVAALAARYHDQSSPGGRRHRLVVVAHPLPASDTEKTACP